MKREVARGALWMLAEMGSWEGLAFVAFLVMTRLLTPADYGVASLAAAIVFFAQVLIFRGLADAVVALADIDEDAISTAFWATLLIAATLFAGLAVAAGGVAWAFGQPLLAPVLRGFSVVLIPTGLVTIPLSVLRRQLRFSAFALRAAGAGLVGGIVGIAMALSGYGVWSLVGNHVAQSIAAVALVWSTTDWRPRLAFSPAALRKLSRFSAQVVLGAELDTLAGKIDLLIVGMSFEPTIVGYYYIVKRILQTASGATVYPIWSVSLPALGRLAGDHARFNKAYVSIIATAQAFWLPVVLGFGVMAAELIPVLFGEHWKPAAPVAASACLLCLSYAVVLCTGQALCAAARADLYARLALVQVLIMGALFGIASRFDVVAAGYALSACFAVMVPVQLWTMHRTTGLAYRDIAIPYARIAVAGGLMAAAIMAIRALGIPMPIFLRLTVEIAGGALAYLGGLWVFARQTSLELIGVAQAALARRSLVAIDTAHSKGGADA